MRKQMKHFLLLIIFTLLLVLPSTVGISQQTPTPEPPEVIILILDRFQSSMLGMVPNPEVATSFYSDIANLLNDNPDYPDLIPLLENDPEQGIRQLFDNLSSWQGDLEGAIGAQENENCIGYFPGLRGSPSEAEEMGIYYINGAGGPSGEPHGYLVSEAIVDAVNAYEVDLNNDNILDVLFTDGEPGTGSYDIAVIPTSDTIKVIEEDTENFRLTNIIDDINQVISLHIAASRNGDPQPFLVINASFAIVPCKALPALATLEGIVRVLRERNVSQFPTPANLVAALNTAIQTFVSLTHITTQESQSFCNPNFELPPEPEDESANVFAQEIYDIYVGSEPSLDSEDCQTFESEIISAGFFVAAAGNSGLGYSFYPASSANVISVSATGEEEHFFVSQMRDCNVFSVEYKGLCSNSGEVLMPGVVERNGEYYFGTSFGTPRMSLRLAVYLAHHDSDPCGLPSASMPRVDIPLLDLSLASPDGINCLELAETGANVFHDMSLPPTPTPSP